MPSVRNYLLETLGKQGIGEIAISQGQLFPMTYPLQLCHTSCISPLPTVPHEHMQRESSGYYRALLS